MEKYRMKPPMREAPTEIKTQSTESSDAAAHKAHLLWVLDNPGTFIEVAQQILSGKFTSAVDVVLEG